MAYVSKLAFCGLTLAQTTAWIILVVIAAHLEVFSFTVPGQLLPSLRSCSVSRP